MLLQFITNNIWDYLPLTLSDIYNWFALLAKVIILKAKWGAINHIEIYYTKQDNDFFLEWLMWNNANHDFVMQAMCQGS